MADNTEIEFIDDWAPATPTHSCVRYPEGTEAVLGTKELCAFCTPARKVVVGTVPVIPYIPYESIPVDLANAPPTIDVDKFAPDAEAPQYEVLETDGSTETYDTAKSAPPVLDAQSQARMRRAAARMLARMVKQNNRSEESERKRQAKVTRRRKRNKVATASRKRNR